MSEKQIKGEGNASFADEGEDLYNSAYTGALVESAQAIVEQNRHLLLRSQERNFNPVTELDFTSNGAGVAIQHLFEEVAAFREGCVPWLILRELAVTTDRLISALKQRKNAPVVEIDAVGVAFRECMILWCDTHSPPRMERETYLKKVFKGKDEFCKALKALHAEYVRIATSKGGKKQTLSAASILEEPGGADERNRIYREIRRLEKGGMTAKKAISAMMRGTYAARMKGVKPETWRRYYNDWKRHRVTPDSVDRTVDRTGLTVDRTVDRTGLTVDRTVDKKLKSSTSEQILSLLAKNPRATQEELARTLGLSTRGIEYAIGTLKKAKRLRKVGGKRFGRWEILWFLKQSR
jgi:hypothetical protein